MATFKLTAENLNSSIQDNDCLIIDFWASWCGPCVRFAPTFEAVSTQYPDVAFAKCDTEAQQEVAAHFGIRSIPTIAIFREQVLVYFQPGAMMEPQFKNIIDQVLALNMEEVHAEIAAEKAKGDAEPKEG